METVVAAHRSRNWRYTIHVKHLLLEDDTDQEAIAVGKQIAAILKHGRDPRREGRRTTCDAR